MELSREARQQATRTLTYTYDHDGSLVLKGRLPAEIGALVIKALDAAVNDPAVRDVAAETPAKPPEFGLITPSSDERPSWGARRADALGRLAESFLQHGSEALSSGDRHQIVVHVDAETVRRLACDASLVSVVENEQGEPLNVGARRAPFRLRSVAHSPHATAAVGFPVAQTRVTSTHITYTTGLTPGGERPAFPRKRIDSAVLRGRPAEIDPQLTFTDPDTLPERAAPNSSSRLPAFANDCHFTLEKSAPSPSAIVGCAITASRRAVYGRCAMIAV